MHVVDAFAFIIITVAYCGVMPAVGQGAAGRKCQEITIPMCRGIAYNYTHYPNRFNHDTQEEAGLEVHQFWPLVEINCSPDLRFFLCSLYAPICLPTYTKPLPACRSVCERAKNGCAPLMRMYGFAWPERMRCEDLPEFGDSENLCMDHNTTERTPTPPSRVRPVPTPSPYLTQQKQNGGSRIYPQDNSKYKYVNNGDQSNQCQCNKCRSPWVEVSANVSSTATAQSAISNGERTGSGPSTRTVCMLGCDSYPHFTTEQRGFTQYWIGIWSVLCCISTMSTVFTFLIDTTRFQYPERSIVYMCVCYVLVSIGYMMPFILDRRTMACESIDGQWVLRLQTRGPPACTLSFLLVYYFGMAASLWWVILSLTWFFAAGLKWGHEAIARYAHYYHIVAWLLPCIVSVVIIATSQVDGDPVSGICFVGGYNITNLRGFLLAPLGSCLALGIVFLIAGFVSLFRIRKVIQQEGRVKTERFEKLMVRIGVFSLLYTLPAVALLACYLYEDRISDLWQQRTDQQPCACREKASTQPEHAVFMLKYLMSLIVGVTSGIWIWTGKTVTTWRGFCLRLCSKDGAHAYQMRRDDGRRSGTARNGVKYALSSPPVPIQSTGLHQLLPAQLTSSSIAPSATRSSMKCSQYSSGGPDSASLLPSPLSHDVKHLPISQV